MNLPNRLTVTRLCLVPVFIILYLCPYYTDISVPQIHFLFTDISVIQLLAFVIFLGASITDFLDGYLARKNHLVTTFGKFVDPIADKMLRAYKGMYCMESFNPLGVWWYRKNHPELVRGQLSDAFLKEGEYVGVLYFILQNLLLNFVTKPDFVAYNHHYPEILSRKLC